MYFPFLFKKFHSTINGTLTLGSIRGHKALIGGGVTQSGGELVGMWNEVFRIYIQKKKIKQFLLLGVGAGMLFDVVKKYFPSAKMTGVDKDATMLMIGEKHFSLNKHEKIIVLADVTQWIKSEKRQYDLIAVDLYIGRLNARGTRTSFFLQQLKKILTPNGVILFNSHFDEKNPREFTAMIKRCEKVFPSVHVVAAFPLNKILLLSKKK